MLAENAGYDGNVVLENVRPAVEEKKNPRSATT
jgi:chaperonin GroEL (HSP60 family)